MTSVPPGNDVYDGEKYAILGNAYRYVADVNDQSRPLLLAYTGTMVIDGIFGVEHNIRVEEIYDADTI